MDKDRAEARKPDSRMAAIRISNGWLKTAVACFACSILWMATGAQAFMTAFYAVAFVLLAALWRSTVAEQTAFLEGDHLHIRMAFGDWIVRSVDLPLDSVVGVRAYRKGEMIRVSYAKTVVAEPSLTGGVRMNAAFAAALLSARAARRIAGDEAGRQTGLLVAYSLGNRTCALVFNPPEALQRELFQAIGDRWGWDDRLARPMLNGLWPRALARAFPDLYPNVSPLVGESDIEWEAEWTQARRLKKRPPKERNES